MIGDLVIVFFAFFLLLWLTFRIAKAMMMKMMLKASRAMLTGTDKTSGHMSFLWSDTWNRGGKQQIKIERLTLEQWLSTRCPQTPCGLWRYCRRFLGFLIF